MAENTKIEWADHTFNPWIGCTKVSPACDNCFAAELMDTRYGRAKWGAGEARVRTGASNWHQPVKWDKAAKRDGTRPFVFCASLADVFDNEVDPAWRADLFDLIAATPNLVWLLLTKRIGNVERMASALPSNVAIGATMANQEEYDRDARKLFRVGMNLKPLFTFGSFEPLLGPVRLDDYAPHWISPMGSALVISTNALTLTSGLPEAATATGSPIRPCLLPSGMTSPRSTQATVHLCEMRHDLRIYHIFNPTNQGG